MTTCPTANPEMVAEQISRCAAAGLDVVRVTVQGLKEAKALGRLKFPSEISDRRPGLVADIHFKPSVALAVAEHVDKVRINPGNFVDGVKTFDALGEEADAAIFGRAKEQLRSQLVPLIRKLKASGKTLRVGVNHGSLSERILRQHGDTPAGMVASALEVVEVCREEDFQDMVISMKSSNVKVMIAAYRLLVQRLDEHGSDWNYPLHVGVTEAGSGADGRVKSAVGIGTLLVDGIGDTIRVSLTEDPWLEAGPCKALRRIHEEFMQQPAVCRLPAVQGHTAVAQEEAERRVVDTNAPGLHREAAVFVEVTSAEMRSWSEDYLFKEVLGYRRQGEPSDGRDEWTKTDEAVDAVVVDVWDKQLHGKLLQAGIPVVVRSAAGKTPPPAETVVSLSTQTAMAIPESSISEKRQYCVTLDGAEAEETLRALAEKKFVKFFILRPPRGDAVEFVRAGRRVGNFLSSWRATQPVILDWGEAVKPDETDWEYELMRGAVATGSLLVDGLAQGVLWGQRRSDAFSVLQACRLRSSKTEFISCPSCGRTLFDLQQTTERIKRRTGHLPGVRIAVMGCIVNGPGEMADAHFGFVGSLPGKVDLYVGKTCVRRGVDYAEADEVLVQLIKDHGLWKDPLPV